MERSRQLRRGQTDAEAKLWSRLRAEQLGAKFRRQHRLDGCILDFVCLVRRLAIVDGSQHFGHARYDARGTAALERFGLRVLRFWNNDVLLRTDDVVESIAKRGSKAESRSASSSSPANIHAPAAPHAPPTPRPVAPQPAVPQPAVPQPAVRNP